jgi:hypothetical protein
MSQYLNIPDAEVIRLRRVDDSLLELPGIVQDLEVRGELEVEEKKLEASSLGFKLIHGFNDADVRLVAVLLPGDDDVEAQIGQIQEAFQNLDDRGVVQPLRVINRHLDSRRITYLLFKRLRTRETSEDDSILVEMDFVDYAAAAAREERKLAAMAALDPAGAEGGNGGNAGDADGEGAPGYMGRYGLQFWEGYEAGAAIPAAAMEWLGLEYDAE